MVTVIVAAGAACMGARRVQDVRAYQATQRRIEGAAGGAWAISRIAALLHQ